MVDQAPTPVAQVESPIADPTTTAVVEEKKPKAKNLAHPLMVNTLNLIIKNCGVSIPVNAKLIKKKDQLTSEKIAFYQRQVDMDKLDSFEEPKPLGKNPTEKEKKKFVAMQNEWKWFKDCQDTYEKLGGKTESYTILGLVYGALEALKDKIPEAQTIMDAILDEKSNEKIEEYLKSTKEEVDEEE